MEQTTARICPKCKNQLQTRAVFSGKTGPMGKKLTKQVAWCPYCEWKGDSGPGKDLKNAIKAHNNG